MPKRPKLKKAAAASQPRNLYERAHKNAPLPPKLINEILAFKDKPFSSYELAGRFGVDPTTIRKIFKKHGGRPKEVEEAIKRKAILKMVKTRAEQRRLEYVDLAYSTTLEKFRKADTETLRKELEIRITKLEGLEEKRKRAIMDRGKPSTALIKAINVTIMEQKALKDLLARKERLDGDANA
jgi:hypothetical protein